MNDRYASRDLRMAASKTVILNVGVCTLTEKTADAVIAQVQNVSAHAATWLAGG